MKKMIMLCPFPPPMMGAAKNSELIFRKLSEYADIEKINTGIGEISHRRQGFYHLRRLIHTLASALKLVGCLIRNRSSVYIVPDGGLGIFYTALYSVICAVFRVRVFFHYRNYSYIDKRSWILSLCIRLQKSVTHILLDVHMKERFFSVYPAGKSSFAVLLNTAFLEKAPEAYKIVSDEVVVGHFSNLCEEKGLYDFIALVREAKKRSISVRFVIAGKAVGEADIEAIKKLVAEYPDSVSYLGALYGKEKQDFYAGCDVFVFPTRYRQEAQPNVIWEAMDQSCVVISCDRASIKWMLDDCGYSISPDKIFSDEAVVILEMLAKNRQEIFRLKALTENRIKSLKVAGSSQYEDLVRTLLS